MSVASDPLFIEITPFRIEPQFVGRVWGWKDLRPWYDRIAEQEPIGEVWLTGDECKIATGSHRGKTLGAIFDEQPRALLGPDFASSGSPLLIKVIFAREKLSVQVHPDDRLAQRYGQPRGKTECWYALAAEPDARVAVGLKTGVTLDEVKSKIDAGTLEDSLNLLPVHKDDLIFVDAGTVHAIWPGSVLLETQQNSDITYRMYDYGRGRELHIERSIESTRLTTKAGKVEARALADRTVLVDSTYFCVERIPVDVSRSSTTLERTNETSPHLSYLFAAAGSARLTSPSFEPLELPERGIVAIPASSPVFAIQDLGGLDLIRISARMPGSVQ
ncbi:type I phosphomannose isomerase catalytic subunit [Occallatibacter savannae]|uniref:type I phosphomannose isomerase catalytic subunit n=1 Tax=Occallatibacter savannae TaxID=1002691 RepID=UPI0013A57D8B|nr:type I phosphomannose isomerase catalytic subunit [Occallatibacter savannae]